MKFYQIYKYINSDAERYFGKNNTNIKIILIAFFGLMWRHKYYVLVLSIWYRMSQINNKIIRVICRIRYMSVCKKLGCQIPFETQIGYGIRFNHCFGIIINPRAVIGNNCNILQMTNIGSQLHKGAQIGNNVYIGPGVITVEGVKIGDNATIGAGSVVVKDIPENATAVGNPCRVVNFNNPARFIYSKTEILNEL